MDEQDAGIVDHPRERHLTEKGLEYQIQIRTDDFRTAVSRWRRASTRVRVALDEAEDEDTLRESRRCLSEEAAKTQEAFERLCALPDFDVDEAKRRYEELEEEHCTLIKNISDAIKELQIDHRSSVSGGSSKKTVSRKSSSGKSTVSSFKAEAAVEIAAAETELKYLESELRTKMELEKLQLSKKLDIAKAKLTAMTQVDDDSARSQIKIPEPSVKRENIVIRYLDTLENGTFPDVRRRLDLNEEFTPIDSGCNNEDRRLNVHAQDFVPQEYHRQPAVHSQSVAMEEPISVLAKTLETLNASRISCPEPPTFCGDPLEYTSWKASFAALIENKKVPEEERLHFLKKYLGGVAKEAVEGLFLLDSVAAYKEAKAILDERFGHPFLITEAFRDKLESWPQVKLPSELRKFSDFLRQCEVAMTCVSGLEILNDCRENRKLLRKVPSWVVNKWGQVVGNRDGNYPSFAEFSYFMKRESDIVNNPITSVFEEKKPSKPRKDKVRCLVTEAKEKPKQQTKKTSSEGVKEYSRKPCLLCSSTEHPLGKCSRFMAKSMDDRKKFVQERRLCYGCLKQGHRSGDCQRRHRCETCSRRHPTALHEDRPETVYIRKLEPELGEKEHKDEDSLEAKATSHKVHLGGHTSSSMIVPVWISSEQQSSEVLTYAMLDTQSDASFILNDVAKALQASQQRVNLKMTTMTSSSSTVEASLITNLKVRGMNEETVVKLDKCYTSDFIPVDRSHIPSRDVANSWPHLKGISRQIPALQSCEVGLLIGYNCPQALAPREVVTGEKVQPYAVRTDLGWSIVGSSLPTSAAHCHRVKTREVPDIAPNEILSVLQQDFAETATLKVMSQEDLRFLQIMEEGITMEAGHLKMPLPFKDKCPELPNNRKMAEVRLQHLKRRMQRDATYKVHYTAFMEEIVQKGYAERAPDAAPPGKTNYIPHHGVYHPRKKDKLRVVFDCSARGSQAALNEHLLKGPDLINGLVGVLCRFREHAVALMCDIEKMFFQFRVYEEDKDRLRFLWFENGDITQDPVDFRMNVHLFGATSSPACANYGLKYLAKEHQDAYPLAAVFIERDFYVDDGLTSVPSTEEAVQLTKEARDLCQTGGLRLHKFVSNDPEVMENIPVSERAKGVTKLNLDLEDQLTIERALGVAWNSGTDALCFQISLQERPMTRRGILSTVASLYDPLGLVSPVILQGKQVLQEMCRNGSGWDDPIPLSLRPRWECWLRELPDLEAVEIPRCYHPKDFGQVVSVELHHFCDASTVGYGQCSYVRLINEAGDVHCSLVWGKSRVAPTKITTIPRLELTAAVVSAKASNLLRKELRYKDMQEFFWTDSQVVLGYIQNEARRFHVFVANRIQLIRELTDPEQWNYIETGKNPADHASRGLSPGELSTSRWFQGPEFLWERTLRFRSVDTGLKEDDPEVKAVVLTGIAAEETSSILDRLSRFSKWNRMVCAIARLKRVASRSLMGNQPVSYTERHCTEKFVIQEVQREAFSDLNHRSLRGLDPFVDEDGILRVGGRLRKARLPDNVKHPIILPGGSHVVKLLVQHVHEQVLHQGRGITLNEIRSRGYWVLGGSKYTQSCIHHCVVCRKLRRPVSEQKMANLPTDRVEPSPPFAYSGMDCFGPFIVRKGRTDHKRYGLVFTCMACRAIHIEMLEDMSTDSFINALRCFIAIRGSVKQLRSDQGSNFVGAKNELKEALKELDQDRIQVYLAEKQCEFLMNAPSSSHAGGVWERQIRTIRSILDATLTLCHGRLDDSSLRTFLYEAMTIVNSRPLSVKHLSDSTAPEPLTPNHLLMMKSGEALPPPGRFVREDLFARKRWRRVQYLTEVFWGRWRKEYLMDLNRRQKWNTSRRNMMVGDIVMLQEGNASRMEWPLAVVTEANPDEDGLVRRVRIAVGSKQLDKQGRRQVGLTKLERPIQKLILLVEAS